MTKTFPPAPFQSAENAHAISILHGLTPDQTVRFSYRAFGGRQSGIDNAGNLLRRIEQGMRYCEVHEQLSDNTTLP